MRGQGVNPVNCSNLKRRVFRALHFSCFTFSLLMVSARGKSDSGSPNALDGTAARTATTVFPLKDGIELEMILVQPGAYTVGLPRTDPLWRADIDDCAFRQMIEKKGFALEICS